MKPTVFADSKPKASPAAATAIPNINFFIVLFLCFPQIRSGRQRHEEDRRKEKSGKPLAEVLSPALAAAAEQAFSERIEAEVLSDKKTLGEAIGFSKVSAIGIRDAKAAKKIIELEKGDPDEETNLLLEEK